MAKAIEAMKAAGIVLLYEPVGSRVTCDPAPKNTDQDHLVLIAEKDFQEAIALLSSNGFKLDNPSAHYRPEESIFNSWRSGDDNILLTADKRFFADFHLATAVAKDLNLLDKADRVTLFQAILYKNSPGGN